jgi:hypothetical protein
MRNKVLYEWDIESWRDGEILDHDFQDKLDRLGKPPSDTPLRDGVTLKVVLVRYQYNDWDGVVDTSWAYVESGVLPEAFDDGVKVPKRFRAEHTRWIKKWSGGEA